MFERFTDRARRVVVLAQEEARMLNHNYIGTEHILLAMLEQEDGDGPLHCAGIDKERAEADIVRILESITAPKSD
jgi:ATP-dependent Clp protease ATP-binding subunit ClpA